MKKVSNACRIIIDTNIWISFLIGKILAGLHKYIYDEKVIILTCRKQLFELSEVFNKPKIKKYFNPQQIIEFFELLDDSSLLIKITTTTDLCRDVKDNYLRSLSIDGKADYLITGDADLLELQKVSNTSIVSFADFAKRM